MATPTSVGTMIRQWRNTRRMSQMALAGEAEISTRHLSFVETGRSQPSREMVLILASVLEIPLRERNSLLLAAGFAPVYRETNLDAPEMASVRRALELLLTAPEPFGAIAIDRAWNILMTNDAGSKLTGAILADPSAVLADGPPNLLRLLFHPRGIRPAIRNWEDVARATISRAHRELARDGDEALRSALDQALSYDDVPRDFRTLDLMAAPPLLFPIIFDVGGQPLEVLTTVTSLGTAMDVTLNELRVESFLPANETSEALLRALAGS